jgi:UDP-glucuronate decarboxylase
MTNFIMQALNGQALTRYGDGSQTRSFCHVNDLVEAIRKMMDTNHDVTGPFNIGNPNEITILELAKKIIGLTQSQSEICFLDLPQDDPTKRKPDIRTAKKGLGWEPKIDLEEGLKGMIEYYKNSI